MIVDCSDVTGDQLDLLLRADSEAVHRILQVADVPEVDDAPSRAMRRVSHCRVELEPTLSKLPSTSLPNDGERDSDAASDGKSVHGSSKMCIDLPSWCMCSRFLGCSFPSWTTAAERESEKARELDRTPSLPMYL